VSAGANQSKFASIGDLKGATFGVSRLGSGSHLMAYVLAQQRGWDPQRDVHFEVTGDFASLRASVNEGKTAAFMWETFTTKPYHDSGEVKRIGQITTPWPCFMMASRKSVLDDEEKSAAVARVCAVIRDATRLFHSEHRMDETIARKYSLQLRDAKVKHEHSLTHSLTHNHSLQFRATRKYDARTHAHTYTYTNTDVVRSCCDKCGRHSERNGAASRARHTRGDGRPHARARRAPRRLPPRPSLREDET
jgi:hypothetical protein